MTTEEKPVSKVATVRRARQHEAVMGWSLSGLIATADAFARHRELLGGLDGDEPARAFIRDQDREIAEKGGRVPLDIKSVARVGAKKK